MYGFPIDNCRHIYSIYTRKMVPITRRASSPNQKKKLCFNNTYSTQTVGIVQDMFVEEAGVGEGGEEESIGGYFNC